jgi:hypothetical protein
MTFLISLNFLIIADKCQIVEQCSFLRRFVAQAAVVCCHCG